MRLLLWTERLLVSAGAAAIVWCAVLVGDAILAQRSARSALEAAAVVAKPVPPDAVVPAAEVPPDDPTMSRGFAVGALSIPRIRLSAAVLHGSDAQTLRRGPGHLDGTALPGEPGNVVIAGHRDSFFRPLRNIQLGDDIFIDTPGERFRYRVASVRVVHPRDVSVLGATDEPSLTLITCYPFWVFGNAPDRFVVRATAVSTSHNDDEDLVRRAVERYRLTYNGRLISRSESGSAGLLQFANCDVTVTGERALAVCEGGPPRALEPAQRGRTFMLERVAGGWAIKAIVVN